MRDYVVRIRKDSEMNSPRPGSGGVDHHLSALDQLEYPEFQLAPEGFRPSRAPDGGQPPPVVPEIPKPAGLGENRKYQAVALMKKDGRRFRTSSFRPVERERYEAAFTRFSGFFPTRFTFANEGVFSRR